MSLLPCSEGDELLLVSAPLVLAELLPLVAELQLPLKAVDPEEESLNQLLRIRHLE